MNLRYSQLIRTTVGAIVMMSLLAACEKGVFMKDTKITTPDFKITTQQPGGAPDEKAQFEIDLKSLMVSDNGVVENVPSWTGVLEFTLNNKTKKEEKRIQISANAVMDKVKSGKVETKPGEPVITYRAKCAGAACSKYYLVVAFHFYDDQGNYLDMKYLVIGWYRDLKQVRRALLENDLDHVTLQKQIEKMEAMDASLTVPPVAGETSPSGVTAPSGDVLSVPELTTPAPDTEMGPTAPTGAETLTAPTGTDDVTAPIGTDEGDDLETSGDPLPPTPELAGQEGE